MHKENRRLSGPMGHQSQTNKDTGQTRIRGRTEQQDRITLGGVQVEWKSQMEHLERNFDRRLTWGNYTNFSAKKPTSNAPEYTHY